MSNAPRGGARAASVWVPIPVSRFCPGPRPLQASAPARSASQARPASPVAPPEAGAPAPEGRPRGAKRQEGGGRWPLGARLSHVLVPPTAVAPFQGEAGLSTVLSEPLSGAGHRGLAGARASGSGDRPGLSEGGPQACRLPATPPKAAPALPTAPTELPRAPPPRAAEVHHPEYRLRCPVLERRPGRAGCPPGAPGPGSPRPR